MNEAFLFRKGIKPGLLVPRDYNENRLMECEPYMVEYIKFPSGLVQKLLVRQSNHITDHSELGIALGYYPPSCHLFGTYRGIDWCHTACLWYNGIAFNTCGLFDEALQWCHEQYGQKILELQGFIYYEKSLIRQNTKERYVVGNVSKYLMTAGEGKHYVRLQGQIERGEIQCVGDLFLIGNTSLEV